jgi:pimeloyl-ACP methyl ester carboxylesterase
MHLIMLSAVLRRSHYPAIKELFPNSEIVDMQTRHWVHVEDPNAFIDAVDTFLRKPLDA